MLIETAGDWGIWAAVLSGDSRLSIQGGHDSKITFIVKPLHFKLDFLHLHTLKIGIFCAKNT